MGMFDMHKQKFPFTTVEDKEIIKTRTTRFISY